MKQKPSLLQPKWLNSLKLPETYPHPASSIQITETHISWIVCTGEWVYKLKKPVNFEFVDFSTLELRKAACHEELRLNRRTALELYDDVVALTSEPSGPRFGGSGPVLEYAVKMHQFSQQEMLDQLISRNALTSKIVESLAREVADLHRSAEVASVDSPFGTPETIRHSVQECLKGLMQIADDKTQKQIGQLNDWTSEEWIRLKATLSERRQQGYVRECHGDLHLGNLVLHSGRPMLFDCLEFNPNLRWIDIVSDIAFLVMDLFDRQAANLAWQTLNEWLQQTGDYGGLSVLRYYIVYRALVRAKVIQLRLQQPDLSSQEKHQLSVTRNTYLELATSLTLPVRPAMVLMHGVSGSGKSFVSQQLASSFGAVQIRSDVERKRLFGVWPSCEKQKPSSPEMYSPDATQQTYARLFELSRQIIAAGYTVIVDATFLRHSDRKLFSDMATKLSIPMVMVACKAPDKLLQERVFQRQAANKDPSDADVDILRQQLATLEPFDEVELRSTITLDTSTSDMESIDRELKKQLSDWWRSKASMNSPPQARVSL